MHEKDPEGYCHRWNGFSIEISHFRLNVVQRHITDASFGNDMPRVLFS